MSMFDKRGAECLGECGTCYGPIFRKTRTSLVLETLAYDLWMSLPHWLAFTRRVGFPILAIAGGHAHTCTCPEKVLA